jgi:hypothetical protein
MITPDPELSIAKQCDLLSLPRSSYYYKKRPVSAFTLEIMKQIDEIYTAHPDFGSRQIRNMLVRKGYKVNRKRIQRLMRIMGIQALFPGKNLSKPGKGSEHVIYPYRLRNLKIDRPNQVWSTDITYSVPGVYLNTFNKQTTSPFEIFSRGSYNKSTLQTVSSVMILSLSGSDLWYACRVMQPADNGG